MAAIPAELLNTITLGDARELARMLPDETIDLIFTDPPYTASDIELYSWLGAEAARLLKPGRYLYAYSGNVKALEVAARLSEHLDYTGMIALLGAGGFISTWRLIGAWKPIFTFCKGPPDPKPPFRLKIFASRPDKRYHRWGQGGAPAFKTIEMLTAPGELVLDPFCGGGTVPSVCQSIGRNFIAFDNDPEAVEASRARLAMADLPMFA
jgi:DNA modification methylase